MAIPGQSRRQRRLTLQRQAETRQRILEERRRSDFEERRRREDEARRRAQGGSNGHDFEKRRQREREEALHLARFYEGVRNAKRAKALKAAAARNDQRREDIKAKRLEKAKGLAEQFRSASRSYDQTAIREQSRANSRRLLSQARQKEAENDDSLVSRALRTAGSAIDKVPGLKKGLELAGKPQEELAQPFYAGFNARASGLNLSDQLLAGFAQTPGLGHLDSIGPRGNELRTYGDAVNTREEREALREEGRFLSPGEFITGKGFDDLDADVARNLGGGGSLDFLPDFLSGTVDAAVTISTDPLTYIPGGVARSGLSRPTQLSGAAGSTLDNAAIAAIGRDARDQFLRNTRRGRTLEKEVRAAAARVADGGELQRVLPDLPPTVARDIAGASTKEAAQDVASAALRSGEYVPDISIRRQALMATFNRGLKAPGGIGLGKRVVRHSRGWGDIGGKARRLANNRKGRIAKSGRLTSTAQARRGAVTSALRHTGRRGSTFRRGTESLRYGDARAAVAQTTEQLSPWDRVNEALVASEELPGLVSDIIESTLEDMLPKSQNAIDFNRKMASLADDEDALKVLLETETLIATARGDFGEEAAEQLAVELGVNFTRPRDVDVLKVVSRAGNRAGLAKPNVKKVKASTAGYNKVAKEIGEIGNEELEDQFRTILANIRKGKVSGGSGKQLTRLRQTVGLAKKGTVAEDAAGLMARYGDALTDRPSLIGGNRTGLGTRLNIPRKIGKVINSVDETVAPNQIRFLSTENAELAIQGRVEAIDPYMGELGLDDQTRSILRQASAELQTESDLYALVDRTLTILADAEGVNPEILSDLLTSMQKNARKFGFKAGRDGEVVDEVQNLSQLTEAVALPDPVDVKRTIRKLKAAQDDPTKLADIRKYLDEPTDTRKIARSLAWVHRTWKLMVVTNLYMPVVGGFAGFIGTDGDFTERLKEGMKWGALGALAPSRYVMRIGVEETARRVLLRGFTPTEFIPGISKFKATHGVDRPLMSPHLLSSGDPTGNWIRNELSTHATGEFAAMPLRDTDGFLSKLPRRHSRYLDSWGRIVNNELNPDNGSLDRYLLGLRAGHITQKEFDTWLKAWFDSDEGQLWFRRWKGAKGAPKSKTEAFWRQHDFVFDYVPEDIARARLPHLHADFQKVPRGLLKSSIKRKDAPAFIHAERTWKLPRRGSWFKDIATIKDEVTDKFIFGGPTRTMQRQPLARHIFKDEYHALIDGGVDPKRAQQLADRKAINVVNDVMFNQNNESRFSSKVDIVFPFQQPREELVRVWAPLAFNNKIRTVQLTALGARALEAGVSNGTFYEYTNPFTGEKEWRMKVPGSASLSRALGGVNAQFDFGLKDVMFLTQGNVSTLGVPSPGGPFWTVATRSYLNAFPDHYDALPSAVKTYLFPFGSSGRLGRAEPNRLWMAFMGTPSPWEFANEWEQREEYNKVEVNMFLHLRLEHFKETGEWKDPSFEEVDEATKAYFQTQALIGAVFPAPTRYVQPWQELVERAQEPYRDKDGVLDYLAFVNDNPNLAPFVSTRGEFVGPDTLENWSRPERESANDYLKHYRERFDVHEFKKMLDDRRQEQEAWQEFNLIPFENWDWETADGYLAWEEKWVEKRPDIVETSRNNYFRDRRLHHIMQMADGPAKDRNLNDWRKKYDVSFKAYKDMTRRLEREGWEVNYWKYSRTTDEVVDEVRKLARRNDVDPEVILRDMNPAEQFKYWKAQQAEMSYFTGEDDDPEDLLNDYYRYGSRIQDLYKKYPKLSGDPDKDRRKDVIGKHIDQWRDDYRSQISALYDEIGVVSERFDELKAQGESWSDEGQALYEKRSSLYEMVEKLKAEQYKQLPGILLMQQDVYAATALLRDGQTVTKAYMRAMRAIMSKGIGNGGFVPSNEELSYLNMPSEVKEAFVDDIVQSLDLPAVKGTKGKLYWEWLSPFEQDLLARNLPAAQVRKWRAVAASDAADEDDGGGGWKDWKEWSFGSNYGYWRSSEGVELSYAFELFDQYNQRPEGAEPPAAYQDYLALPANPIIRNDFLDKHPQVAEWIAAGPMANMPTHLRYIVQNIMVKYGKWEGEVLDDQAVVDLSFAREQLKRWNRRGELDRPGTYDKWLQMPTGVAKAEYLKAHPEIRNWLRLGPMANMPDAYQDVIRDIMIRYGEWTTDGEDSLGKVINGYYETPAYARRQYLEEHPELAAYWAAIRTPEEQKMAAKVDQYFSLSDPNARQVFLITHPEVRQHFVDGRTKRYEDFLNQVAIYMGSNPELFETYLERQEDVINDLMLRYAEPNLLREIAPLTDADVSDRQRRRG